MKKSEQELIRRCTEGNTPAWEAFIKKYSRVIYSAIYGTLKKYSYSMPDEDISDLHNEVITSLIENDCKKLRQYQAIDNCSFSTWLGVVVVRTTINFIKKTTRKNKRFFRIEDIDNNQLASNNSDLSGQTYNREMHKSVCEIIRGKLKPREQLFLRLHFEKGFSVKVIAGIMNLSANTVYVLKFRILRKIKKIYCKK